MNLRSNISPIKRSKSQLYNDRHRVCPLAPIPEDNNVWITTGQTTIPGRISHQADTPRSYVVETSQGQLRRNRCHLRVIAEDSTVPENNAAPEGNTVAQQISNSFRPVTRSMTGTAIQPPDRLRL